MRQSKAILVFGATGPAGVCLLRELLHRGYRTIAYVRSPGKVPADLVENNLLKVTQGDLADAASLGRVMSECCAVVSLLGPNQATPLEDAKVFATYYSEHIFPSMRAHSVERIYAMGTISIHRPEDHISWRRWLAVTAFSFVYPTFVQSMLEIEKTFHTEAQDLQWLVYRVGALLGESDEDHWCKDRDNGRLFLGWVGEPGWSFTQKRGLLARWLVDAVEGKADAWLGRMPAVSTLDARYD